MDAESGWRPLEEPPARAALAKSLASPFGRLALTHAVMAMGDALLALALAGSLFFSISPDAARPKVALYLLLTMLPFAVLVPLIGPWVDSRSGGRRTMIVVAGLLRALLCLVMSDDLDKVLFFPEALGVLVLGRAYGVARASLVPGLVGDARELVRANSRMVVIAGVAGALAIGVGVVVGLVSTSAVLWLAALVYAAGGVAALRIPPTVVASGAAGEAERVELRGANIVLSGGTMAVLRGGVGFVSFLLAFLLRADDAPTWWFGLVAGAGVVGSLGGAVLAPVLRRRIREERILLTASFGIAGVALVLLVTQVPLRPAGMVLAFAMASSASAGKVAFDSIVQRDAPDANTGRSFARFETRFQLAWVAGSFLPVAVSVPLGAGLALVALVVGLSAGGYATGRQVWQWRLRRGRGDSVEVDPGQPEPRRIDLGRGGQLPG